MILAWDRLKDLRCGEIERSTRKIRVKPAAKRDGLDYCGVIYNLPMNFGTSNYKAGRNRRGITTEFSRLKVLVIWIVK